MATDERFYGLLLGTPNLDAFEPNLASNAIEVLQTGCKVVRKASCRVTRGSLVLSDMSLTDARGLLCSE